MRPSERLKGAAYELAVRRWRAKRSARAVFTLDSDAASQWRADPGAPVVFLPEPPIQAPPPDVGAVERNGFILYGALAPRKGLGYVVDALAGNRSSAALTLAGPVTAGYGPALQREIGRLTDSGVQVRTELRRHDERTAQLLLSSARAVLLPYVGHIGMSRVLLEAAHAGTPVIGHARGLLGELIRRHRLGIAVDCTDARALRAAILEFEVDSDAVERYRESLVRFTERHSAARFTEALGSAL